MRRTWLLLVLLLIYCLTTSQLALIMDNKSYAEKLGYVPSSEVLSIVSADQKPLMAASLIMKVLIYYGGIAESAKNRVYLPTDYQGMSRMLHGALKLDPYNMDGYYFAQAILVWDVKQIKLANDLLNYGMKYRSWDYNLPFFAGFNSAYFLKDYNAAAVYYKRAAELSGNDLFIRLAGRYLHESGQTELAIVYLTAMERSAQNDAIKNSFRTRLTALRQVRAIEAARDLFIKRHGRMPKTVEELVANKYLTNVPSDPYGGNFFIEKSGQVQTTSKFAFIKQQHLNKSQ